MNYVILDVKTRRKPYISMNTKEAEEILAYEPGNKKATAQIEAVASINARMLTLEQYHTLARRVIGRWAPANAKMAMLNSEDAIDFVAHRIMIGDWDYNAEKAGAVTYRGYCGKRAIQIYLDRTSSKRQKALTNILDADNDGEGNIYDVISDKGAAQPFMRMEQVESKEEIRRNLSAVMGSLNDTQRACVILHFMNDMPMADISREIGITREGVRKSIEDAMKSIRKIAGISIRNK